MDPILSCLHSITQFLKSYSWMFSIQNSSEITHPKCVVTTKSLLIWCQTITFNILSSGKWFYKYVTVNIKLCLLYPEYTYIYIWIHIWEDLAEIFPAILKERYFVNPATHRGEGGQLTNTKQNNIFHIWWNNELFIWNISVWSAVVCTRYLSSCANNLTKDDLKFSTDLAWQALHLCVRSKIVWLFILHHNTMLGWMNLQHYILITSCT